MKAPLLRTMMIGGAVLSNLALADDLLVPGDYPTLRAAIASAESGDRILVDPAVPQGPPVLIEGKELTIASASTTSHARIQGGGITIRAGARVRFERFDIDARFCGTFCHLMFGVDCQSAELEMIDCTVRNSSNFYCGEGSSVFLSNCVVGGMTGVSMARPPLPLPDGVPGITIRRASRVRIADCIVAGGNGASNGSVIDPEYTDGGDAISATGPTAITVIRSTIAGGAGGFPSGNGGVGLRGIMNTHACSREAEFVGGADGFNLFRSPGVSLDYSSRGCLPSADTLQAILNSPMTSEEFHASDHNVDGVVTSADLVTVLLVEN